MIISLINFWSRLVEKGQPSEQPAPFDEALKPEKLSEVTTVTKGEVGVEFRVLSGEENAIRMRNP